MNHIGIFKTTHHMNDGIHLADVGQELISQSFPVGCSFYQTCNIHELDGSRDDLSRIVHV